MRTTERCTGRDVHQRRAGKRGPAFAGQHPAGHVRGGRDCVSAETAGVEAGCITSLVLIVHMSEISPKETDEEERPRVRRALRTDYRLLPRPPSSAGRRQAPGKQRWPSPRHPPTPTALSGCEALRFLPPTPHPDLITASNTLRPQTDAPGNLTDTKDSLCSPSNFQLCCFASSWTQGLARPLAGEIHLAEAP